MDTVQLVFVGIIVSVLVMGLAFCGTMVYRELRAMKDLSR